MSDENDNVVDLAAFRKQKEVEEEEKARIQREVDDEEEIESMRYLLNNIMEQIGDPTKTGSMFYVPMSDEDYFSKYYTTFESGYNEDGYYESTWESPGFSEDFPEEEDDEGDV